MQHEHDAKPFLIIGAQKSATTALSEMIAAHPDVYSPRGELLCFEDPYDPGKAEAVLDGIRSRRGTAPVYGFKRAELLHNERCAERIKRHLPNAKLIAVLREPISRTVAAYFHYARGGLIPLKPLEAGLTGLLDGAAEWEGTLGHQIVEHSHYAPQLEKFRAYFGKDLTIFTQDDLRANPNGILTECFRKLGVDPGLADATAPLTKNVGVYSTGRLRWIRLGSKLVYQHDTGLGYFTIHPSRLRLAAFYATSAVDRAIFRGRRGKVPELSTELRERLGELFLPDIEAAEEAVGHALPGWRKAARPAEL